MAHNASCDKCNVYPIIGIRYKCSFRSDYDLCEKCEATTGPHPYGMIKIRNPNQANFHITCKYAE